MSTICIPSLKHVYLNLLPVFMRLFFIDVLSNCTNQSLNANISLGSIIHKRGVLFLILKQRLPVIPLCSWNYATIITFFSFPFLLHFIFNVYVSFYYVCILICCYMYVDVIWHVLNDRYSLWITSFIVTKYIVSCLIFLFCFVFLLLFCIHPLGTSSPTLC